MKQYSKVLEPYLESIAVGYFYNDHIIYSWINFGGSKALMNYANGKIGEMSEITICGPTGTLIASFNPF